MSFIDRALDSKLAWGVVTATSVALIVGGVLGHSFFPIVAGSIEFGAFSGLKIVQAYKREVYDSKTDKKVGFTPSPSQQKNYSIFPSQEGKNIRFDVSGTAARGKYHREGRTTLDHDDSFDRTPDNL